MTRFATRHLFHAHGQTTQSSWTFEKPESDPVSLNAPALFTIDPVCKAITLACSSLGYSVCTQLLTQGSVA